MNKGSIEIVCGPMFSGKTEELLRKLNRLHFAKTDFLLFKPSIDTRYNEDKQNDQKVVSHSQNSMSANIVESAIDILKQCEVKPHIKHVGIDEIQFLPS
jgi:thymidine kinase